MGFDCKFKLVWTKCNSEITVYVMIASYKTTYHTTTNVTNNLPCFVIYTYYLEDPSVFLPVVWCLFILSVTKCVRAT